ncbi:MAG: Maltodextrin ABC transporter, permease protein MdxG, partial [uncultured Thermomicrobiales bacterium]
GGLDAHGRAGAPAERQRAVAALGAAGGDRGRRQPADHRDGPQLVQADGGDPGRWSAAAGGSLDRQLRVPDRADPVLDLLPQLVRDRPRRHRADDRRGGAGRLLAVALPLRGGHRLLAAAADGPDVPPDPDPDPALHPVPQPGAGQHPDLGDPALRGAPPAVRDLDVQGVLRRHPAGAGGGGNARRGLPLRGLLAGGAAALRAGGRGGDDLLVPFLVQRVPDRQHLPPGRGDDDDPGRDPDVHAAVPDGLGQPDGGGDARDAADLRLLPVRPEVHGLRGGGGGGQGV